MRLPLYTPLITTYIALGLSLSLGLAGCATKPTPPPLATQTQADILYLTGRLSLVVEQTQNKKQAATLAFTLQGNTQRGTLHLRSPLGNTLGIATWSPQSAILRQNKKRKNFASLADLLHAIIGTPIPTQSLFDWLRGNATPVSGWKIDLSKYQAGKIKATRLHPKPIARLRIVIQ